MKVTGYDQNMIFPDETNANMGVGISIIGKTMKFQIKVSASQKKVYEIHLIYYNIFIRFEKDIGDLSLLQVLKVKCH